MVADTFTVDGMNCQHCVESVTEAVRALAGVHQVALDLPTKEVSVTTPSGAAGSAAPTRTTRVTRSASAA